MISLIEMDSVILLFAICTVLFVSVAAVLGISACMLSSMWSQAEEEYAESQTGNDGDPLPRLQGEG
jgi:flagellar basal body-associated protein FliL